MAACGTVCQLLDIWATKDMDHPPVLFSGELLRHALGRHHRAAEMRCQEFFPNRGEHVCFPRQVRGHVRSHQHVGMHIALVAGTRMTYGAMSRELRQGLFSGQGGRKCANTPWEVRPVMHSFNKHMRERV